MADISMCQNKNCKLNTTCYRFIAKANELYQSYSIFIPELDKNGNQVCEHYYERGKENEDKRSNRSTRND